jgi:hypothetical protein
MNENTFPPGWDSARVQKLISRYDSLDEGSQRAEDEAFRELPGQTTVVVPIEFLPAIRKMLAHKASG